jgi:predicted Zn-dependent protease with MMP-like domain
MAGTGRSMVPPPDVDTLSDVRSREPQNARRAARITRRDRHGRGLRGPLAPRGVPLARTRAQRFEDLILEAVTRLEGRWEEQLSAIEFAVEEVPPQPLPGDGDPVPLSRLHLAEPGRRARIIVYRRPVQARAEGEDELAALVSDVVVEEFARLLSMDPEDIDPGYAGGD